MGLESAFAAIIEPYAGEPFITSVRQLEITDNETDARRAVALGGGREPGALDALALALASDRRFAEAAQTAEKAADLADREGRDKLAEQIRGRVALYRRGVPFVLAD